MTLLFLSFQSQHGAADFIVGIGPERAPAIKTARFRASAALRLVQLRAA
jgi:hypothetical protein